MRIIIAICLAIFSILPITAKADFNSSDRAIIQAIVEEFIRDNPEVIRDTLLTLAAKEDTKRKQTGLTMLHDDHGDPVMGNPNGNITIYEFSDYNCGYCKRFFQSIRQLLLNSNDVRLVVKEFPILSQSSMFAAKAAIAAEIQGKFEDFHVAMMNYRGKITNEIVINISQQVGLDKTKLKKDMESSFTTSIIQRTRDAAALLDINGTPGLVIGDNIIPGAIDFDELQKLIANARAKQS